MATEFTNHTATPVGLWDTDTVHHVAASLGGTVVLNTSQSTQETIDILVSAGAGAVSEVFAPENVAPPSIIGTAKVGETLTGDDGEWSGTPAPTLTRQWKRDGGAISGATGATYDLVEGDVGAEITITVTATNSAGAASETSAPVGPVEAALSAPVNTSVPAVTGDPQVGETLSATNGVWTGNPAPSYTLQWERSANGEGGWEEIAGATSATYELVEGDEQMFVRCVVTAENSEGSDSAESNVVGPVTAEVAP